MLREHRPERLHDRKRRRRAAAIALEPAARLRPTTRVQEILAPEQLVGLRGAGRAEAELAATPAQGDDVRCGHILPAVATPAA